MSEQTRDEAVCGRCGHTAFWHSGFGTGECQVRTGCDCHEFKLSVQASPAPERAALLELANEAAAWLDRIRDSFRRSGHDSDGDSLYSQEAMGAEHYAARLREAAALLKGEQGDPGGSESIEPHAVAHLALTRKTYDTPEPVDWASLGLAELPDDVPAFPSLRKTDKTNEP